MGGINDGVHPQAGGGVARIGLVFVGGADGFDQFFFLFFVYFFAFAFELLQFYFGECAGSGVAAHHRKARRGPGEHEARVVGFAAHGVISSAETAAANYRYFWHHAVCHSVHHFRAGADDAVPLGVFADHEAVYVVQKNKRNSVLVAVENEARRFFRGLGVNHAAKFDAFLVRAARQRLHVLFLIRHNPDGPAADAGVSAKKSFAVLRAVFFEFACVHDAGDDFPHVVLFAGIARKYPIDVFGGKKRLARFHVAEGRSVWRANFVDQRANSKDARIIVWLAKIHGAADLRMHFRATEIFGGSLLADRRLHQRGAGQK